MKNKETFPEILSALREWLRQKSSESEQNGFVFTLLADQEDFLCAEFMYQSCAAELVAAQDPGFAPYHHVSFEAVAIISGSVQMLCFWYDTPDSSVPEIVSQLEQKLSFVNHFSATLPEADS